MPGVLSIIGEMLHQSIIPLILKAKVTTGPAHTCAARYKLKMMAPEVVSFLVPGASIPLAMLLAKIWVGLGMVPTFPSRLNLRRLIMPVSLLVFKPGTIMSWWLTEVAKIRQSLNVTFGVGVVAEIVVLFHRLINADRYGTRG